MEVQLKFLSHCLFTPLNKHFFFYTFLTCAICHLELLPLQSPIRIMMPVLCPAMLTIYMKLVPRPECL